MAAALQCEICGGKLVGKPGGIFECDSCGVEYSTEWAKQKIQEIRGTVKVEGTVEVTGKVQVDGGTVNVEGAATKESLLKRAKMCYADGDWKKAAELLEQVLNADPECGEAYLYRAAIKRKSKTLEELRKQYEDATVDSVFSDSDMKKAFQFAEGELAQTLGVWKQTRESAIAADLAQREENKPKLAEARNRVAQLSKLIGSGNDHIVGLKSNGTVVAVGSNYNVDTWRDIVAVCAGYSHTVGLKSDGTVVAAGNGRCNVSSWREIVAVCAGDFHTVGLKFDGTVAATGKNDEGQCNVSGWRDIVAVCAGYSYTVGLKSDGTVVAAGNNDFGRCNVSSWREIVTVCAGIYHTVGLKSDGTVAATGMNPFGQCNVSSWREIVAVCAGTCHTVGLKFDGTVVAAGKNDEGQCNVSSWRDIVAVCAGGSHTVGLKSDGTVVVTRRDEAVKNWKLFQSVDTLEEEQEDARKRREEEQEDARKRREAAEKCAAEEIAQRIAQLQQQRAEVQSELASLKGLFTGKQRRELESRLAAIDNELKGLN